jgi:hypothetical protein
LPQTQVGIAPAAPPLQVVEAALHVAQLGEELQRVPSADGVPGTGAQHGDRLAELLDFEDGVCRA